MRIALTVAILGLCTGTPVAAQDAGYALRFDGQSDFVRLGPTADMLGPGWQHTKTVSLWLKPTGEAACTAAEANTCDAVFGDRPRTWGISRGVVGGQDRLWIWNFDGTVDRIGVEYVPGEWLQVALVHANGMLRAYRNGALIGSVPSGPTAVIAGQALQFGGVINNASRNWTFQGEIDEVQLWSAALEPTAVAAIATAPLSGGEPGLAAYYQMSDGAGSTLTDNSGRGWTGLLVDGGSGVPADGPIQWVASGALSGSGPVDNQPPVADPQNLVTPEDTPVPLALSGSDPDGGPVTFQILTAPTFGTLTGTDATRLYVPAPDFHGADSFTFAAYDGRAYSAPALVSIAVTPVNDLPVAADDALVIAPDTTARLSVLQNDSDVDGDVLSLTGVQPPMNGTATIDGQAIVYTPVIGFTGTDVFGYTISDGLGGEASAIVTITMATGTADAGYALRFDGQSDFVRLGQTAAMFGPGWEHTKSVSLWLKPTSSSLCTLPDPAGCALVFGDRPRWWGISIGILNGLDRIWVWNWDGGMRVIPISYVTGEWLHISLVHGNGLLEAYRNGLLVDSLQSGPTLQPHTGGLPVLYFGGIVVNTERVWTFAGEIDELQLWKAARTAAQVQQDMSAPLLAGEPSLAAYYRMSDGSGEIVTDDSGNGWAGTLHDGGTVLPPDGPILWVPSGAFQIPLLAPTTGGGAL